VFMSTMVLIVIGAAIPVVATDFLPIAIGVGILGLGVGADLPVALATISEAASDSNRGKIIVFSNMLGTLGIAAAVISSIVGGGWGRFGGQILFGQVAVVGLITLVLRLSVPESRTWLEARLEQSKGIHTVRADKARLSDMLKPPYRRPFVTLITYYTLTTLAVTVGGTYGTYVAFNIAHIPIQQYSTVSLICLPLALIAAAWFAKVADTKLRMPYFVAGGIGVIVSYMVPALFGFNELTIFFSLFVSVFAGAFCYETIMKVWTQESFPTMLRSTAQGLVYSVSRFAAALLAVVTPSLLGLNPNGLYMALCVLGGIGLTIGWLGFRKNARNEFDFEESLDVEPVLVANA
jgi:inositol transporter-like SP family MFS transporter